MKFFSLAFFIGLSAAAAINLRAEDPCRIVKNVTIVSGDTLGAIAEAQNTTVAAILSVNPSITSANAIFLDQVVAIPSSECVVEEVPETPAATATCVAAGSASTYTVVAGDVLTDIAASLGITLDSLVAANPDINPDVLSIDQVLDVPVCDA